MESDEKYIEARLGRKSPFVVPEGYFDNLAQSIVDNVASANIADKKMMQMLILLQIYVQSQTFMTTDRQRLLSSAGGIVIGCALLQRHVLPLLWRACRLISHCRRPTAMAVCMWPFMANMLLKVRHQAT